MIQPYLEIEIERCGQKPHWQPQLRTINFHPIGKICSKSQSEFSDVDSWLSSQILGLAFGCHLPCCTSFKAQDICLLKYLFPNLRSNVVFKAVLGLAVDLAVSADVLTVVKYKFATNVE